MIPILWLTMSFQSNLINTTQQTGTCKHPSVAMLHRWTCRLRVTREPATGNFLQMSAPCLGMRVWITAVWAFWAIFYEAYLPLWGECVPHLLQSSKPEQVSRWSLTSPTPPAAADTIKWAQAKFADSVLGSGMGTVAGILCGNSHFVFSTPKFVLRCEWFVCQILFFLAC